MKTAKILSLFIFCINHLFLLINKKITNDTLFNTTWELEYLSGSRIAFTGLYPDKKPIIAMKNLIILSLLAISFSSCKNNTEKEQNTSGEKKVVTTEKQFSLLEVGCYSYHSNDNAINIEITSLKNGVTGKLTYALDGKDRNSGTFNGKLNGDKLFGTYTFISEGIESKREVAFLIKDNQLIEGYGELNENGTAFVDKSTINYTSTMPLTKTDCDK